MDRAAEYSSNIQYDADRGVCILDNHEVILCIVIAVSTFHGEDVLGIHIRLILEG